MQLTMFPERVRYRAVYEPLVGGPQADEVVDGEVYSDFGNGYVAVLFDGTWCLGSVAGCRLIIRRDNLEPATP